VRIFTAQTREGSAPVLIPEGFSLWALVFGPFWLAFHGAWMLALAGLATDVAVDVFAPWWADLAVAVLYGMFGQDLRRYALELRGYTMVQVVAARDADTALGRLLAGRPDLMEAAR